MAVRLKRFRIEQPGESLPGRISQEEGISPFHADIFNELREIRGLMVSSRTGDDIVIDSEADKMRATLQSYRSQIDQYEKLKVELDNIRVTIDRTKREIAVVHGRSFEGDQMLRATGELNAVVGGTESATQQILSAAETIDEAASAIARVTSADQRLQLSQEIQERVVAIFEACNFQDLTGQRIGKVLGTIKLIEEHINTMMDIWGGIEEIRQHAPEINDERVGDAQLLNGPQSPDADGHASQNDIDALFP